MEVQDAVLELETSAISGGDGVDKIMEHLNRIYKEHKLSENTMCLNPSEQK